MTKSHKLVKKRHKNVNLGKKMSQTSEKDNTNVNLGDKKSQISLKKTRNCKFRR